MTLRIERSAKGEFVAFTLSGRINGKGVAELQRLFEVEGQDRRIVLDLKAVNLVGQDAVRFLARCEANGIDIETCPAWGRALRIIGCIEDPEVIAKILTHLDKKATAQETGLLPKGQAPPAGLFG